eukprot:SAG31_NODE_585_length_13845_cov_25.623163_13_plen_60_part_00
MMAFLASSSCLVPLVDCIADPSVEVAENVCRALILLVEHDPDTVVDRIMNTGGMHGECN